MAFKTALDRGMERIDYALDVLAQDGYPPLTTPLTLTKLNRMTPEQAQLELQKELRRTLKKDELTGALIPDNATLQLIRDYMAQGAAL